MSHFSLTLTLQSYLCPFLSSLYSVCLISDIFWQNLTRLASDQNLYSSDLLNNFYQWLTDLQGRCKHLSGNDFLNKTRFFTARLKNRLSGSKFAESRENILPRTFSSDSTKQVVAETFESTWAGDRTRSPYASETVSPQCNYKPELIIAFTSQVDK